MDELQPESKPPSMEVESDEESPSVETKPKSGTPSVEIHPEPGTLPTGIHPEPGIPVILHCGKITVMEDVKLPMPFGINNLVVEAGMVSDGQSTPRGLWWLTGPPIGSPYIEAWLGHDLMCERAANWTERTIADGLLAFWLKHYGAGWLKTWSTYFACLTWGRFKFLARAGWSTGGGE